MRAEFLKVRSMPTPRWTLLALLLCLVLGVAGAAKWGVGEEAEALDLAIAFPTWIGSLVFGVWVAGVEFGQNTLRRTLAADPRRIRMVLAKLGVAAITVTVVTVVLTVVGAVLYDLAGSGEHSIGSDQAARILATTLLGNLVATVVGMGLTLLTRSMAGGLTITLVFFFVLDSALSFAPKVGDYSLGTVTADLEAAIRGNQEVAFGGTPTHDPAVAALLTAVWVVAIFAAGAVRTVYTEAK